MATEYSPRRKRQAAKRRARQEQKWASRSGPVTTRLATPDELARAPQTPRPGYRPPGRVWR